MVEIKFKECVFAQSLKITFGLVSLFNGISTLLGHLMPKQSL